MFQVQQACLTLQGLFKAKTWVFTLLCQRPRICHFLYFDHKDGDQSGGNSMVNTDPGGYRGCMGSTYILTCCTLLIDVFFALQPLIEKQNFVLLCMKMHNENDNKSLLTFTSLQDSQGHPFLECCWNCSDLHLNMFIVSAVRRHFIWTALQSTISEELFLVGILVALRSHQSLWLWLRLLHY